MKKIILIFLCAIFLTSFVVYAEIDKDFKEKLNKAGDILKEYTAGLVEAYKEMAKYQPPYYTYDKSFVSGVAYIGKKLDTGNIAIIFNINNQSKTSFDVSKANYFGVDGKGNIFKFEFGTVLYNEGIHGSSFINPQQEIQIGCIMPFTDYYQARALKEVYLKTRGKRIYFIPEKLLDEYSKPENKYLRKARDFFRDF